MIYFEKEGLVRSPISATLPQIGSRLYQTWGTLYSFPEILTYFLVNSLVISWSITEKTKCSRFWGKITVFLDSQKKNDFGAVSNWLSTRNMKALVIYTITRFSFFGMRETVGFAPSWLLWLRYNTFLILYPSGISSEVGLIYIARSFIKTYEKYCIRMPNKWNFSFECFYVAVLLLLIYVSGSPHMYGYMLGQRKKALSKSKRE